MTDAPSIPTLPPPSREVVEGALEQYALGVSALPLPGGEREGALLARVRQGDRAAAEALAASHLRFVVDEALRVRDTGVPLSRLIQAGNQGLREAVARFRGTDGGTFGDYARAWIRREMRRHLDDR